jgi:hypothetical protein
MKQKEYSHCLRCGRKLKSKEARERGMGIVCFNKSITENKNKPLFTIYKSK